MAQVRLRGAVLQARSSSPGAAAELFAAVADRGLALGRRDVEAAALLLWADSTIGHTGAAARPLL